MTRRGVWAGLAALICAGCGSSPAATPSAPGSQADGHLRVPMLPSSAGTPRIVGGTAAMRSRARAILGRMGRTSVVEVRFGAAPEEPAFPPRYPGPALWRRGVRTAVAAAATRAGFHIAVVRFIAADRLTATVVVSATRRKGFGRRYVRFLFELGQVRARLAGLQWQIADRCGTPIAVDSAGSWTNPRWLCPAPAILGPATSPARCRRLARSMPRCSMTGDRLG